MGRNRWNVAGGFSVFATMVMVLVTVAVAGGCASRGYQKADQQTLSMQAVQKDLDAGTLQIQKVLGSLDQLTAAGAGGDVKAAYNAFADAFADMKSTEKTVKGRADALRAQSSEYFAAWSESLEQIENPELKGSSEDRQARAKMKFDELQAKFKTVREAYDPFVRDLEDLKVALPNDLSSGGLTAAAPTILRAKTDGTTTVARIADASTALRAILESKQSAPTPNAGGA